MKSTANLWILILVATIIMPHISDAKSSKRVDQKVVQTSRKPSNARQDFKIHLKKMDSQADNRQPNTKHIK